MSTIEFEPGQYAAVRDKLQSIQTEIGDLSRANIDNLTDEDLSYYLKLVGVIEQIMQARDAFISDSDEESLKAKRTDALDKYNSIKETVSAMRDSTADENKNFYYQFLVNKISGLVEIVHYEPGHELFTQIFDEIQETQALLAL